MKKLRFLLIIDSEGGFYYKIPSPHFSKLDVLKWKINVLRGKLYRYSNPATNGIKNIVKVLKNHEFPASFCICGHLYLKNCEGWKPESHAKKPENSWYKRIIGENWYYWDKGGNSEFYLGDFIEKEMKQSYFNFGLHGFAHEAMTLENKEVIKSIIEQGVKAAEKLGIKIKSFAAPFDMVEEEEDPEKIFEVLKKNGIKNVTYSGTEHQFEIKRKFSVEQIKKRSGLNLIWLSNYFEGSFSNKKMNEVFRDILKNKNKDAVYCLATHDFTHKNIKNIERLVKFIKNLEAKGEIEILDLNKNVR